MNRSSLEEPASLERKTGSNVETDRVPMALGGREIRHTLVGRVRWALRSTVSNHATNCARRAFRGLVRMSIIGNIGRTEELERRPLSETRGQAGDSGGALRGEQVSAPGRHSGRAPLYRRYRSQGGRERPGKRSAERSVWPSVRGMESLKQQIRNGDELREVDLSRRSVAEDAPVHRERVLAGGGYALVRIEFAGSAERPTWRSHFREPVHSPVNGSCSGVHAPGSHPRVKRGLRRSGWLDHEHRYRRALRDCRCPATEYGRSCCRWVGGARSRFSSESFFGRKGDSATASSSTC
jgi:hypothetical protein